MGQKLDSNRDLALICGLFGSAGSAGCE